MINIGSIKAFVFSLFAALIASGKTKGVQPLNKKGALTVTVGYGAGSSGAAPCQGMVNVSIRNTATNYSESKGVTFDGLSGNTAPACAKTVTFPDLEPGTYVVNEICTRTVAANQFTDVSIRLESGCV
jgi:uncharacterized protein (DUF2141 family)